MIAYLQRAIGYSLTGNAGEQCLFFLHGHGSNGKSTFIESLTTLLGDFSVKTPIESLLVKKGGGGIPNDLARLNGVRLVTASEVDDGNRLNESLVKDLTGGDTISARFLHGEFFDFKPIFKLWMFGNHKPIIRGTDKGMWRRVHLIEFGVTISPDEKDRLLPEKLRNELPGILAWAVQGCLNWQKEGLNPPPKVLKATAEYQAEMDILGVFISERCTIGDGLKASAKELYAAYKTWALDSGEFVATQRRFGQSLTERGFQRVRKTDGIWWHGITVSVDSDMNTAGGGETEI
jgi:putative DNA primase/helicase